MSAGAASPEWGRESLWKLKESHDRHPWHWLSSSGSPEGSEGACLGCKVLVIAPLTPQSSEAGSCGGHLLCIGEDLLTFREAQRLAIFMPWTQTRVLIPEAPSFPPTLILLERLSSHNLNKKLLRTHILHQLWVLKFGKSRIISYMVLFYLWCPKPSSRWERLRDKKQGFSVWCIRGSIQVSPMCAPGQWHVGFSS